jgi:hypothetical protein
MKSRRNSEGWTIRGSSFTPKKISPTQSPGPKNHPLPTSIQKTTIFQLESFCLFLQPLLEKILQNMNKQSSRSGEKFCIDDLLLYTAIKIVMRLSPKPTIEHHWSTDLTKGTGIYGTPFIKKAMALKRFKRIHSLFLDSINDEKLLTELVKMANEIIINYWNPYQHISLDDGFPQFDGKSIYTMRKERKVHQKGTQCNEIFSLTKPH